MLGEISNFQIISNHSCNSIDSVDIGSILLAHSYIDPDRIEIIPTFRIKLK